MKTGSIGGLVLATLLAASGVAIAADVPESDQEFVKQAAVGGLAEVEMGKLAQEKASSTDVKQFAARMVNDHTKANAELTKIAERKKIEMPAGLDAEHQAKLDALKEKSGELFNREYMQAQVEGHAKMHALFEAAAKSGGDGDLKGFAAKTVQTVAQHHRLAEEVKGKLGESGKTTQ